MKKHISILAALLTIVACQIEELPIGDAMGKGEEFEAYTESDGTRTSMDSDFNVIWSEGDEVSIFAGSTVNQHYKTTSFGTTSTSMEVVIGGGFVAGSEIPCNVAVYPYSPSISIKKSGNGYLLNNVTIPSEQTYCASSFGNGTAPMMAVTSGASDMVLKFRNAFGGINLQLTGTDTIKTITLKGNNGEIISGTADVSVSYSSVPSITMTGDGSTVTLNCGTGVKLDEATPTSFYIVLPPVVLSQGFTAVVTDTEGKSMTMTSTKTQTISRNTLLNMPVKDYTGEIKKPEPLTFKAIGTDMFPSVPLLFCNSYSNKTTTINIDYQLNDEEWNSIPRNLAAGRRIEFKLKDGDIIKFRAGEGGNESLDGYYFQSNMYMVEHPDDMPHFEASGNIMSLINGDKEIYEIPSDNCFNHLLAEVRILSKAPELPATILKKGCYKELFNYCEELKVAPCLPADMLCDDCYKSMFGGCSSLTAAPELNATSIAKSCYQNMFYGCTSLTEAPELKATALADYCYSGMFHGCTSLTEAPELKATVLADYCYSGMFDGCTSLAEAPELKATELANGCYSGMFEGCTSLAEAPELKATALADGCYSGMFEGCTSLAEAPELKATELANSCYSAMFRGCTSLTKAPDLLATTLAEWCYSSMFLGCNNLSYVKMMGTSIKDGCFSYWLDSVATEGTFVKSRNATWDNGFIPSGWTIITE